MQRVGIFGGSFNPPHKGHLYIASEAMKQASLDKIIFVPCGTPPHKTLTDMASAKHRFEMTRIALKNNDKFEISDLEIKSEETSYTARTLPQIKLMYPEARLCFIVGGDSFRDMERWYHPEEIFPMAEIVVVDRGGISRQSIEEKLFYYKEKYSAEITLTKVTPLELSSSAIRKDIAKGKDVSEFVSGEVLEYIQKFGIYKDEV